MSKNKKAQSVRIAPIVLAFFVIAIVFFSAFFIAAETHHECSGEDCPVCICIQCCMNALKQLGDGSMIFAICIIPILSALSVKILSACVFVKETPVSQKVRMND